MNSTTSPLESLAAFAIAFAAGVVSTVALGAYVGRIKNNLAKPKVSPEVATQSSTVSKI